MPWPLNCNGTKKALNTIDRYGGSELGSECDNESSYGIMRVVVRL